MCISSKNAENIAHIYKKSFLSGIIRQCIEEYWGLRFLNLVMEALQLSFSINLKIATNPFNKIFLFKLWKFRVTY